MMIQPVNYRAAQPYALAGLALLKRQQRLFDFPSLGLSSRAKAFSSYFDSTPASLAVSSALRYPRSPTLDAMLLTTKILTGSLQVLSSMNSTAMINGYGTRIVTPSVSANIASLIGPISGNISALKRYNDFGLRLSPLFDKNVLDHVRRSHEKAIAERDRYVKSAVQHRWFVPAELPYDMIRALNDIACDGRLAGPRIRHLFLSEFRADDWRGLADFVDAWRRNAVLEHSDWKVLRDSAELMKCHGKNRRNAANVVLPAVVSVIDHLLNRFARQDLNISVRTLKANHYRSIRRAFASPDADGHSFSEPACALAFDVLFEPAFYGEVPLNGPAFNRHKIMHGQSAGTGTAANVLRAFFIVDFLIRAIQEFRDCRRSA